MPEKLSKKPEAFAERNPTTVTRDWFYATRYVRTPISGSIR
jgi:hypothetical protein